MNRKDRRARSRQARRTDLFERVAGAGNVEAPVAVWAEPGRVELRIRVGTRTATIGLTPHDAGQIARDLERARTVAAGPPVEGVAG